MSRQEPVLRLDIEGVTVGRGPQIPWDDLSEVRLMLKPRWLFASGRHRVVGFMPRPGRQSPALPSVRGRANNRPRRYRERFYGTNLLVLADTVASADEIAVAAHRIGGVPVSAEPLHPVRRWLVLIAVAVAAGIAVPTIRHLLSH